jgi:mannosyl-oligosaccharide alpha-1,2-mannosidase
MYRMALPTFSKYLFFRPSLPGNPDILFPGYIGYAAAVPPMLEYQVQHLGCFVGGMVGLGSRFNNLPQERWEELETAKKLTDGCVWAYSHTPSGIIPEVFHVNACPDRWPCAFKGEGFGFTSVEDPSYQLRPEAIGSVFIMYRLTADPSWQDKGWKMFQNTMIHTKTNIANARLKNVMDGNPEKEDSMESFWLAETLKYYFLLFSDPGVVSLDDFVLNTEAHPFRLRNP